jgi:hypothetical protein
MNSSADRMAFGGMTMEEYQSRARAEESDRYEGQLY